MSSVSIGASCVLRAPGRTALDLTNARDPRPRSGWMTDARSRARSGWPARSSAAALALHGQLSQPEHESLVGGSAMTVDGDVYLDGLRTDGGAVNFRGATLGSLSAAERAAAQSRRLLAQPQPGHGQGIGPADRRLHLDRAGRAEPGHHRGPAAASPAARSAARGHRPATSTGTRSRRYPPPSAAASTWAGTTVSPSVDFTDVTTTFAGRRPGDLAGALRHRGADLRAVRAARRAPGPGGSGTRPPGAPGCAARRSSTPGPTSRRPGCSASTATPAKPSTSSSPSASTPARSAGPMPRGRGACWT